MHRIDSLLFITLITTCRGIVILSKTNNPVNKTYVLCQKNQDTLHTQNRNIAIAIKIWNARRQTQIFTSQHYQPFHYHIFEAVLATTSLRSCIWTKWIYSFLVQEANSDHNSNRQHINGIIIWTRASIQK